MKVCIVYGLPEGRRHSKLLRTTLNNSGFELVNDPQNSDIIVAHSGGCYALPPTTKAKLVILIGLPLWSGKTILKGTRQKIKAEVKDIWWAKKIFFDTIYFFAHPVRWRQMKKQWDALSIPNYKAATTVLIHNKLDSYMNLEESKVLANKRGWGFESIEGQHDDLWIFPEKYVDRIKKYVIEGNSAYEDPA